jgi:hypothetical protein
VSAACKICCRFRVSSASVGTEPLLNTNVVLAVEQTRGLGLDLSWNGERQAKYGYVVDAGRAENANAHDSGYALVFEFHSSTAERGQQLRGKEDGEEEPGVGLANESVEVQSGRDGGLLKSIANLGASKSCARVWLGGGALTYSALGALPLVRALVACRRRAGVGARVGDSASANACAGAPSVGGETYDQQVQPQRLQQQHEGVGGGGDAHAAGGQQGNDAEYAAGRASSRPVVLSVCSHTHARTQCGYVRTRI